MKRSSVAMCAATTAVLAGAAALVHSQRGVLQDSARLQPLNLLKLSQAKLDGLIQFSQIGGLRSFTDVNGKMVGGAPGRVVIIGEDGKVQKSFQSPSTDPIVSPRDPASILIGDRRSRKIFTMSLMDGSVKSLLDLGSVKDPAGDGGAMPNFQMAMMGNFEGVASDGNNVYVGFQAGFSSSILKIDPATKQVVGRGFATAADPAAMSYNDGTLFVLVGDGSQVRRFTPQLEKSHDHIDLPFRSAKGLGIRSGEIRVLRGPTSIARLKVDPKATSRTTLTSNLDKLRIMPARQLVIKFPPLNLTKRYAVLVTGDLAENFFGECFWNDTYWLYKTLIANGYKPEDIFVLYGDGADFHSLDPYYQTSSTVTDFGATSANLDMVFDGLKNGDAAHGIPKMDSNDTLFVWTFDHGGSSSGASYLCLRGPDMTAAHFATKINGITYAQRAIFMQQCFSGGFIPGLQNSKTYISTACRATEVAHAANGENEMYNGKTYSHGEFNYYVISALNRLKTSPPGGAVNADSNADTYIQSKEMHTWNVGHEDQPEIPQQADLGGIGTLFKFKK